VVYCTEGFERKLDPAAGPEGLKAPRKPLWGLSGAVGGQALKVRRRPAPGKVEGPQS